MPTPQRYPQPLYNVGVITAPTQLGTLQTFGTVDFAYSTGGFRVIEYDNENPLDSALTLGYNYPSGIRNPLRSIGVLDDLLFFIDNTDPSASRSRAGDPPRRRLRRREDCRRRRGHAGRLRRGPEQRQQDQPLRRALAARRPGSGRLPDLADDDEWVPNVDGEVGPDAGPVPAGRVCGVVLSPPSLTAAPRRRRTARGCTAS